ncbi:nicotinamide riboside kinase 2 [Ischnura elegans]|uniref:nicotinamide riboside kinase 2 n=1 Tax=Ischnura elegans TaxID=197161 RepID=UPI001ED8B5D0|nr:nicotinamide riboside kinase 2 [Ischnura elegans]
MYQWLVIGISGVTNGGKTSLTFRLKDLLIQHFQSVKQNVKVLTLSQDDYFLKPDDPRHVLLPSLGHFNWDIISSVDFSALHETILKITGGSPEQKERQFPLVESRKDPIKTTNPLTGILLVEGFLILNYQPTSSLCHLKYYMLLSRAVCTSRRVQRSYDPPDVPGYFEECVWPEHVKYRTEILGKGVVVDKSDPPAMDEVSKSTEDGKLVGSELTESISDEDGDFYLKRGGNVLPLTNFGNAGLGMVDNIRVLNGNASDKETIAQFVFKDVMKEIQVHENAC